jgi:hypothetical protein
MRSKNCAVMNDYDKDELNGDVGIVEPIDTVEQQVMVRFDERLLSTLLGNWTRFRCYAVTICRCPKPNSNRSRSNSFVFLMDNLLAGTLFSLCMEFQCRVIVQRPCAPLLLPCGKHSAPSRTPFRWATQNCSPSHRNRCSSSDRNAVRLHTGIAFTFDRIPQVNR